MPFQFATRALQFARQWRITPFKVIGLLLLLHVIGAVPIFLLRKIKFPWLVIPIATCVVLSAIAIAIGVLCSYWIFGQLARVIQRSRRRVRTFFRDYPLALLTILWLFSLAKFVAPAEELILPRMVWNVWFATLPVVLAFFVLINFLKLIFLALDQAIGHDGWTGKNATALSITLIAIATSIGAWLGVHWLPFEGGTPFLIWFLATAVGTVVFCFSAAVDVEPGHVAVLTLRNRPQRNGALEAGRYVLLGLGGWLFGLVDYEAGEYRLNIAVDLEKDHDFRTFYNPRDPDDHGALVGFEVQVTIRPNPRNLIPYLMNFGSDPEIQQDEINSHITDALTEPTRGVLREWLGDPSEEPNNRWQYVQRSGMRIEPYILHRLQRQLSDRLGLVIEAVEVGEIQLEEQFELALQAGTQARLNAEAGQERTRVQEDMVRDMLANIPLDQRTPDLQIKLRAFAAALMSDKGGEAFGTAAILQSIGGLLTGQAKQ